MTSVQYATVDGTARAGTDYTASSGLLSWSGGDTTPKVIMVPISASPVLTGPKTFSITLSAPTAGATLASPSAAVVTITPPPPLSIKVSGNHLVDGYGKTVQLRGVNVSGLEAVAIDGWDPSNPWGAQTGDATPDWNLIRTWNGAGATVVNAVRLPLNEASWASGTCVDYGGNAGVVGATIHADPGSNYQATVQKSVADATAAGLYVILDLHWTAPGNACPTAQNSMADSDHSLAFWTSLASTFKGYPNVVFELFNEPFLDATDLLDNTPWTDLLNGGGTLGNYAVGGSPSIITSTWHNAGMQQMLNAVRATGATNVVLTAPLAYASAMDGWLQYRPTDSLNQLGAVWHAYTTSAYPTLPNCSNEPSCGPIIMAAAQAIVAAGFPVVITEFGDSITPNPGNTSPWASVLLPFADTNGMSYLAWTWDTWSGYTENVLITDEAGDPTHGYGTYVKQHYVCVAAGTGSCR